MFCGTFFRWLSVGLLWLATGLALPAWAVDQIHRVRRRQHRPGLTHKIAGNCGLTLRV